ncbi:MAG: LTA synthase family protein [Lachnospiraceae bacterium]|nr:LTA synthase family protein [Lachnospiraceae bacterium]
MKEKVLETVKKIFSSVEMYFILLIIFFETFFHFIRLGLTGENLFYKILFALFFGAIIGLVTNLFPEKISKVLTFVFTIIITIYFIAQVIYSGVFATYLSFFGTIAVATQALDFTDVIWKAVVGEWWVLLIMLAPIIALSIWLRKHINFNRHELKIYAVCVPLTILSFLINITLMKKNNDSVYSAYEVYKSNTSVDMTVEKLGVLESLYLDAKFAIKDKLGVESDDVSFAVESYDYTTEVTTESTTTVATMGDALGEEEITTEEVIDTSPNVLDVDFDTLIAEETNSNIVALHEYISTITPTNKNEYTGMFEGYNLIFVVAEGFSGYSIDRHRTPTLYELSTKGFVFKNYYTPLWYGSTLGGEYADLTGLMPKNGSYLSMYKSGANGNDMMFTLSKQLLKQGYTVKGYHNNEYTYYDRHISHTNLGYEWYGTGNGYEPERAGDGTQLWPQSDLHLIDTTFDGYINQEPFHTYYLTVSGHVMYNFGGNEMAKRHQEQFADLEYSETTKAYIACQYELELAMTSLIQKLEDAGVADRTLIVLTADHVPYDNKDVVDELAGKELDNTFEWYENALIIWSASMEEPVTVNKYCSSLDILPTVSNLMGLPYDSRMLVGQDILSDSEGLVMFNDRSFITDRVSYNANTGEVRSIDGSQIDMSYVEYIQAVVKNKFSMAEKICENDYYRYIDEAVYGVEE